MGENTHVHMDQMVEVYPCICCQLPLTLHYLYVVQIGTLMYLIFADPFSVFELQQTVVTAGPSSVLPTTASAAPACFVRPRRPVSALATPRWAVPALRKMFASLVTTIFSFCLMLDVFLASVFSGAGQQ